MNKNTLKQKIVSELLQQGWIPTPEGLVPPVVNTKEQMRGLHSSQRIMRSQKERKLFFEKHKEIMPYFAAGHDVVPERFDPELQLVETGTMNADLFRIATLLWSVPVSSGYGRRMRYVIVDRFNNKLVGLFALGDPVFNLTARDSYIGWDQNNRKDHLYQIMDGYVMGAVPPYNQLLAGKFVALAALSNQVRKDFEKKYGGKRTIIQKLKKKASLVLVSTSSALGKSSIYNRLKWPGEAQRAFTPVGFSNGWGHFHISDDTFMEIRKWLRVRETSYADNNRFGQGPNWRLRTIRQCFDLLGLSGSILNHGIQREVFLAPTTPEFRKLLRGKASPGNYYDRPIEELVDFFKNRWMVPRSLRTKDWQSWQLIDTLDSISKNSGWDLNSIK